jgi:sucrose-6-phosphate hydrolase SacC (GH32 family)
LPLRDLREWQDMGVLAVAEKEMGYMWECPDFFTLNGKRVLHKLTFTHERLAGLPLPQQVTALEKIAIFESLRSLAGMISMRRKAS